MKFVRDNVCEKQDRDKFCLLATYSCCWNRPAADARGDSRHSSSRGPNLRGTRSRREWVHFRGRVVRARDSGVKSCRSFGKGWFKSEVIIGNLGATGRDFIWVMMVITTYPGMDSGCPLYFFRHIRGPK